MNFFVLDIFLIVGLLMLFYIPQFIRMSKMKKIAKSFGLKFQGKFYFSFFPKKRRIINGKINNINIEIYDYIGVYKYPNYIPDRVGFDHNAKFLTAFIKNDTKEEAVGLIGYPKTEIIKDWIMTISKNEKYNLPDNIKLNRRLYLYISLSFVALLVIIMSLWLLRQ